MLKPSLLIFIVCLLSVYKAHQSVIAASIRGRYDESNSELNSSDGYEQFLKEVVPSSANEIIRNAHRELPDDSYSIQNNNGKNAIQNHRRRLSVGGINEMKFRYQASSEQEREDHMKRWGIMGNDLVDMSNNIANLNEPYNKTKDTSFFFMIPKSGTTTFEGYLSNCITDDNFVIASSMGRPYYSDKLQVVQHSNNRKYLNVDVTKRDGLDRAYRLGLAKSALADVMISPYPIQVASIFSPNHKARMFTLMRHPIQRIMSEFYYVQVAEWEPVSYKPWLKNWTLEQYVKSDYIADNAITRQLVGKSSERAPLTMDDVHHAMKIVSDKCLVGLTTHYKESLLRFQQYFGWQHDNQCFNKIFKEGGRKNVNKQPHVYKGPRDYEALMEHNQYDLIIWAHAVKLFEEQATMFEPYTDS